MGQRSKNKDYSQIYGLQRLSNWGDGKRWLVFTIVDTDPAFSYATSGKHPTEIYEYKQDNESWLIATFSEDGTVLTSDLSDLRISAMWHNVMFRLYSEGSGFNSARELVAVRNLRRRLKNERRQQIR